MADISVLEERINQHIQQDDGRFGQLMGAVNRIETNHLAHMEPDLANVKSDIGWLRWAAMLILGGIIMLFLTSR